MNRRKAIKSVVMGTAAAAAVTPGARAAGEDHEEVPCSKLRLLCGSFEGRDGRRSRQIVSGPAERASANRLGLGAPRFHPHSASPGILGSLLAREKHRAAAIFSLMRCVAILTALVPLSLAAQTPPPNDWTIGRGLRAGARTIDTLP